LILDADRKILSPMFRYSKGAGVMASRVEDDHAQVLYSLLLNSSTLEHAKIVLAVKPREAPWSVDESKETKTFRPSFEK